VEAPPLGVSVSMQSWLACAEKSETVMRRTPVEQTKEGEGEGEEEEEEENQEARAKKGRRGNERG
jgi:hypothetical protein